MLYSGNDIRNNCACGRELASALAVKYNVAGSVAANQDSVEYVVNARKLALVLDNRRENADRDLAALFALSTADELDLAVSAVAVLNVLESYLCDALGVYALGVNMLAECEGSQNAYLAACVVTINVSGRIALCIAQFLSDLESLLKVHAVADHLC